MTKAHGREPDEAAFRKLFEAEDTVGLAVLDTEGRIRFANAALGRLCGKGPGPEPGTDARSLFAAETAAGVAALVQAALAGPPVRKSRSSAVRSVGKPGRCCAWPM